MTTLTDAVRPDDAHVRDAFLRELGCDLDVEGIRRGVPVHVPAQDRARLLTIAARHGITVVRTGSRYRVDLEYGTARWSTWSLFPAAHAVTAMALVLARWQSAMEASPGSDQYWGCRDVTDLADVRTDYGRETDSPERRLYKETIALLSQGPYGSAPVAHDPAAQILAALLGDALDMGDAVANLTVMRLGKTVLVRADLVHTARALVRSAEPQTGSIG